MENRTVGRLLLQNGEIFEGLSCGVIGESVGEVVFNTSMTGYQEILTDPSYFGQILTMTYPLIGNYGVNDEDVESSKVQVRGFIVRQMCDTPSNFRSRMTLREYLVKNNIVALEGIDTRKLVVLLREYGTMNGVISSSPEFSKQDWLERLNSFSIRDAVKSVTRSDVLRVGSGKIKIALIDFGVKKNIVRMLVNRGCSVDILPANVSAEEIISGGYHGIMLTNGPGDPKECVDVIELIKKLQGSMPIFGICLGHQLLALANGFDTVKLKYGHRGANHPVLDLESGKSCITSQNHGYSVDEGSIDKNVASVTHISLNDRTVEGIEYKNSPCFSVQFHPEASAGPSDAEPLFDKFISMIENYRSV